MPSSRQLITEAPSDDFGVKFQRFKILCNHVVRFEYSYSKEASGINASEVYASFLTYLEDKQLKCPSDPIFADSDNMYKEALRYIHDVYEARLKTVTPSSSNLVLSSGPVNFSVLK